MVDVVAHRKNEAGCGFGQRIYIHLKDRIFRMNHPFKVLEEGRHRLNIEATVCGFVMAGNHHLWFEFAYHFRSPLRVKGVIAACRDDEDV